MSSMTLFYIAILVFVLMLSGLYLSVREFIKASQEPGKVKNTFAGNVIRKEVWSDQKYGT